MASARGMRVSGVGLGLRNELSADLLLHPHSVDFIETVVEACFASPQARREAAAMAELWPVIPHGIKMSLGSADGIEEDRARRVGDLIRELRAPLITEHAAFVRGGNREIGHLTPLPYTPDAVKVVARNVARFRRLLPEVPLLLENVAWTFRWPNDSMGEADFYTAIVEATGCDLLLDLGNLYANALNEGLDPIQVLLNFPLEHVGMVHIAGGIHEGDFYFDTHAHPVPDAVFHLLDLLCERRGAVPVVIERDALFPPFVELEKELGRSRKAHRGDVPPCSFLPVREPEDVPPEIRAALLEQQRRLALLLTSLDEPSRDAVAPYSFEAIARSRDVLKRKRVDDALPLLPRLSQYRVQVEPLAYRTVAQTERSERMAAVADAIRIARSAAEETTLRRAALLDGLVLEARFLFHDGKVLPRRAPFLRRQLLPEGQNCWIFKGFGAGAGVRLLEPSL
ncbi:MAG: DUF692 domain-containing protein [Polyangiaceae bacterium]|nr:DUF692 domain-containing protein [Polyangiaceae bacterium]